MGTKQKNLINPNYITIEIRAGAGGEEAGLFAHDLFDLYSNYAQNNKGKIKIIDYTPSNLGGYKKIIFQIKASRIWLKLKYEGGVHRVQRRPQTGKGERIHTSTVSVATLPKYKRSNVRIDSSDLDIDFFKSSGPGGQNVNKRQTAVRITHKPTGLTASSQGSRSQAKNRAAALDILKSKITQAQRKKHSQNKKTRRKKQIRQARRAQKIRTYHFPQNRLTDHRINEKWHNLEDIMDGNLEPVIKKLQKKLN